MFAIRSTQVLNYARLGEYRHGSLAGPLYGSTIRTESSNFQNRTCGSSDLYLLTVIEARNATLWAREALERISLIQDSALDAGGSLLCDPWSALFERAFVIGQPG